MPIVRPDLATGGVGGGWCEMISLAIYGDTGIEIRPGRVSRIGQTMGIT
jgi:hypothetical protein